MSIIMKTKKPSILNFARRLAEYTNIINKNIYSKCELKDFKVKYEKMIRSGKISPLIDMLDNEYKVSNDFCALYLKNELLRFTK